MTRETYLVNRISYIEEKQRIWPYLKLTGNKYAGPNYRLNQGLGDFGLVGRGRGY